MNKLENKRVLFYVPGNDVFASGVYHTQVFGLAQYLATQGARCVIVHTDSQEPGRMRTVDGVEFWSTGPYVYAPLPLVPFRFRKMVRPLEGKVFTFRPTHVYARDSYAGVAAIPLVRRLGAKYVFSCRGAGLAKSDTSFSMHLKEWLLWVMTWRTFRAADHVSSVCETLRQHVRSFYRYRGPDSVFPGSAADEKFVLQSAEQAEHYRQLLRVPNEAKVVVYSGSTGWYQNLDAIVSLMKQMYDIDKRLVFLFQVANEAGIRKIAERVGLPSESYRVCFCRPEEVGGYLKIATAAFALRTQDEITRLASPIKVGEYLATGLGVIANPWIGDLRANLSGKACAFLYDGTQTAEELVAFVASQNDATKQAARQLGRDLYSYDGNRKAIDAMFSE